MRRAYLAAFIVLAVLTVISLTLNGLVLYGLLRFAKIGRVAVSEARALLAEVGDETFSYSFQIENEFPFQTTIPVNEEITVPFKSTIPINTVVTVPINLGFTTYNLRVPINTVFPMDMEFTVPVSMTMDVDLTVPMAIDVPIEIPVGETPFIGYVEEADAELERLERDMDDPLGLGVDPLQLVEEWLGG